MNDTSAAHRLPVMPVATGGPNPVAPAQPPLTELSAKRAATGALVGNVLEWYDFFLFNTATALVFNVHFFTSDDPAFATAVAFATFSIGFFVRPLGGLFFGALGDRVGRKRVLLITVVGIGIVTGLIGLLPTTASIGVIAPIAVIVLRIAQGFFIGGEWSGAMTLAVEHAPPKLRARMAALPQIGAPIATLLTAGGFFLLSVLVHPDIFNAWAWRIPFLLAFPLLGVAVWLRLRLNESPVFAHLALADEREERPVRALFREHWRPLIVGMAASMVSTGCFYLVTVFVLSYGGQWLRINQVLLLAGTLLGAACQIVATIHAGRLGERHGAHRIIFGSGVAAMVSAVPIYALIATGVPLLVLLGIVWGVVLVGYSFGALGALFTGLFPARVRTIGVAGCFNGANTLSGTLPLVATLWVVKAHGMWWPAAVMFMLCAALTVVGGSLAPRHTVREDA